MPRSTQDQALLCSPFLQRLHERHPDWLAALQTEGRLDHDQPPQLDTLDTTLERHGLDVGLRRFRQREMMRIVWRELNRQASLEETFHDLTRLAELCLDAALEHHFKALEAQLGTPRDQQGEAQGLVVLGLGKLGGGELNLSSDIDVIFCFPESGQCDGRRRVAAETFFLRMVRRVIKSLAEITSEGFCFRVDARLRPFGESGPLVCSFGALEQYYQREGRDWERYALIKARAVAGDRPAGEALLKRLTPFVYRRYIDFGAVEALREMLDSIRTDARMRSRHEDVKRGPGGIREVEFLVQCVQLLRGGREPALQTPGLLTALQAVKTLGLFPEARVTELESSYRFLRRLENAIQALHDQQTHSLPEGDDLQRVATVLGFNHSRELKLELQSTRRSVEQTLDDSFPRREEHRQHPGPWRKALRAVAGDPSTEQFIQKLDRQAPSARARERLDRFMALLAEELSSDPPSAAVLDDVFALVLTICRRSAYLSLLVENPAALRRTLKLFAASHWVAHTVIRHPALLDELIDPALGFEVPDRQELTLVAKRMSRGEDDGEAAINSLNHLKLAQSLRIAVAELEGVMSSTQAEQALTELAEVLLQRLLERCTQHLQNRHGAPGASGLAIAAYGSLGAADMSFESDLDLVFLYPDQQGTSDGVRPLAAETWFTRLARRLLALATTITPAGRLYEIDTRLRPNGRAGLLVSTMDAFERYQNEKAWVWEWQALSRARVVAGNAALSRRFQTVRQQVLSRPRKEVDLRKEVAGMRQKMRAELTSDDVFKHGPGGLIDIDFLAQLGILELAPSHPEVLEAHSTRQQLVALGKLGWIPLDASRALAQTHRALTRARHLLVLCRETEEAAPDLEYSLYWCGKFGITNPDSPEE